jgi:chorismate mutase
MKTKEIVDDVTMKRAITRITYEIIERNKNLDNIVLAGIKTRGVFIARRIQDRLKQLEGIDIPVLIKNPVNPDLDLWIGAVERIYNAGIRRIGAIHRGFSTFDKKIYRNLPQWHIPIELHRQLPNLPIICDPSHIGGKRELIAPLCQQAMDLNFDGLIVESHCHPEKAWSDAAQQVTPEVLDLILNTLVIRDMTQSTENLTALRRQIDELDNSLLELLARRMRVSEEIGQYKKEHNMPILQAQRYDEILKNRISQAEQMGMDAEFMKTVLVAIHEESVRHQQEIMKS